MSFCVGYYYGHVFAAGSIIVGVVVLVTSGCLPIMDVVFMVEFVL